MTNPLAITWQEAETAEFMSLAVAAASEAAVQLVEGLLNDVVLPAWPEGLQRRKTTIEKHRRALAVLIGELQRFDIRGLRGKHGMGNSDFVGAPFGRDVFRRTADALKGAGLLEERPGWRWTSKSAFHGGATIKTGSSVTTFGLTESALERLDAAGIDAERLRDWRAHWTREDAALSAVVGGPLVELRAAKVISSPVRQAREALSVNPENPKVARIIAELEEHNAFMAAVGVRGASFYGLKRVFNNGDQDGFAWQWGGKIASRGPSGYETETKRDRLENMIIGGEPVVEIDIRASHYTLLCALSGYAFGPEVTDPYYVEGVPRDLVKNIVVQAIGRGDLNATTWSDKARADYARAHPGEKLDKALSFRSAKSAVCVAMQALVYAGAPGRTVHDLNYHEAEIMMRAMATLRTAGWGSLPVHDCLIVPLSAEDAGKEAIRSAFAAYIEEVRRCATVVIPALTVERREAPKIMIDDQTSVNEAA
ncbi:hypothetical protein [Sphingomonas sp.]|uniref:hypothetical protein n=1 Tax=Sphingomonas sp. TaxID=28214 RepID=UPI002FD943A3